LALDGSEWSASCPIYFTPHTHQIRGWMGPTTVCTVWKKKSLALKIFKENSLLLKKQKPTEINEPRKIFRFMEH
jgi:hypothetical protein